AAGVGNLVLRVLCREALEGAEAALFATAVGLVVYTYAFMAVGWAQLLRGPVIEALVGVGLVPAAITAVRHARSLKEIRIPRRPGWGTVLLVVALTASLYVALVAALGPEVWFDARWYHLGVPVHFAAHGGVYDIVRQTRIAAAALTPYQEMLYSGLIPLLGMIGAKVLHC